MFVSRMPHSGLKWCLSMRSDRRTARRIEWLERQETATMTLAEIFAALPEDLGLGNIESLRQILNGNDIPYHRLKEKDVWEERIVESLREGARTHKELAAEYGTIYPNHNIASALRRMVEDGRVERHNSGGPYAPFLFSLVRATAK